MSTTNITAWLLYGEPPPSGATQASALLMSPGCSATITGILTASAAQTSPGNYTLYSNAGIFRPSSGSQSIFWSSSVGITPVPNVIKLSQNMNVGVIFTIATASNSTGFYFVDIVGPPCPGFRLAIGSPASALNLTDWGGIEAIGGCTYVPVSLRITEIQGASVVPVP